MPSSQLTDCPNCPPLQELLDQIDCTLVHQVRNRWANLHYNTREPFSETDYFLLARYRDMVQAKLLNPDYLILTDIQDFFQRVLRLVFKKKADCQGCVGIPSGLPTTSTSSTSTSSTSSTTSTSTSTTTRTTTRTTTSTTTSTTSTTSTSTSSSTTTTSTTAFGGSSTTTSTTTSGTGGTFGPEFGPEFQ